LRGKRLRLIKRQHIQEREDGQPWICCRIKKGSFFLTTGGDPYDVRWKAVSPEPYETMLVFVELPILSAPWRKSSERTRPMPGCETLRRSTMKA
jgi:hypothetical protein